MFFDQLRLSRLQEGTYVAHVSLDDGTLLAAPPVEVTGEPTRVELDEVSVEDLVEYFGFR